MALSAEGSRLIETRVFAVVMVFSILSGVNAAFAPYVPFLLMSRFELSEVEVGVVSVLISSLQYLVSPVLFFVVLYLVCGGPLLNRIASVLISLVFGGLVGYTVGGLIGSSVVGSLIERSGFLVYQPVSSLAQHVVGQMLMGFAVLAFSDVNLRWRSALTLDEFQKTRPKGVTLLAALYVVFALLSALALPVLIVFSSFNWMSQAALVAITLGAVIGLIVVGQLIVAAGLYYGRKWGWVIAVISSAGSLVISLFSLDMMVGLTPSTGMFMLVLVLFAFVVGFIVDLAVLVYLLRIEVRRFFGFVNPPRQVADKSTGT